VVPPEPVELDDGRVFELLEGLLNVQAGIPIIVLHDHDSVIFGDVS